MAIDPVTGLAIASAGVNLVGGLFSMFKKDDKVEDRSGKMLTNLASMEGIAQDLRQRQGLPDTVIGRMERQVSQGASQIAAEGMQLGRQSILANPLLIDQLAQKALEKSAQFIESGTEKIGTIDVQAVESNLNKTLQARSQAGSMAAQITDYQSKVDQMNKAVEQAKMQNMANMFGSAASSMVTLAGVGDGKKPDTTQAQAQAGVGAAASAVPMQQQTQIESPKLGMPLVAPGTFDMPTYNTADDTELAYLDNMFNFS